MMQYCNHKVVCAPYVLRRNPVARGVGMSIMITPAAVEHLVVNVFVDCFVITAIYYSVTLKTMFTLSNQQSATSRSEK
jgi:hypothetical protein